MSNTEVLEIQKTDIGTTNRLIIEAKIRVKQNRGGIPLIFYKSDRIRLSSNRVYHNIWYILYSRSWREEEEKIIQIHMI